MAFHFSLETLLRFRQGLERRQETLLQAANQRLATVRSEIDSLGQFLEHRRTVRSEELSRGTFASELQFEMVGDDILRQRLQVLHQECSRVQASRDEQLETFRKARTDREAVESIRDRQLRAYNEDQRRREQRQLDDLFLMRREFLRRG
jgi:flagellar export protein FliJ